MPRFTLIATAAACATLTVLAPRALADTAPTFQVLHDDHIGAVAVPAGTYTLAPFGGLTEAQATQRFGRFLQDFDGRLPAPWTLDPMTMTFARGAVGFRVVAAPDNTPASTSTTGAVCPGDFVVEHDDRIAGLPFPAGRYQVASMRSTCRGNMAAFRRLLARGGGRLPAPWSLDPQTGTFSTTVGARFRVKKTA